MMPNFDEEEFNFLGDAAELIINARRCLAYTYAVRYYLTGSSRQLFFDHIQGMLERSLEELSKKSEESWETKYIEVDTQQRMQLG
jgi:hypothetical protein